jgi:26S proteasome regulatory subunit N7
MAEEHPLKYTPPLYLSDTRFLLTCDEAVVGQKEKDEAQAKLLADIEEHGIVSLYLTVHEQFKWEKDDKKLEAMKEKNAEKVEELNKKIADAKENFGESEVRQTNLALADHYAQILDKENAVSAYRTTMEKTVGLGEKLDIAFTLIRIGFFWKDNSLVLSNIEKAKDMLLTGGDWDRKNRLKVYQGLYFLSTRAWEKAANLLLETLATYTCTELFDYKRFIFYTMVVSLVTLKRQDLKKRIIDSPEVLSVIDDIPDMGNLVNSFYNADYRLFFQSLAGVVDSLKRDRYFASFAGYFCREMRIKAYCQLLESYRSMQISSLADAFGVSQEFIDSDLSRFIYSGRVHCKIDAVRGIIETNRPDAKNSQYQMTIKSGDQLMHRVQKLSRVII